MSEPRASLVAGTCSAALVGTAVGLGVGLHWLPLLVLVSILLTATSTLAWARTSAPSPVLAGCTLGACAVILALLLLLGLRPGGGLPQPVSVLAVALYGALVLGPWALATFVLRHLLVDEGGSSYVGDDA